MKIVNHNNGGQYYHQVIGPNGSYFVLDRTADQLYDKFVASGESALDDYGTFDELAYHLYRLSDWADIAYEDTYTTRPEVLGIA